ncbi:MAG: hypothetical protein IMW89_10540 [Ktedonobacteraceae bacterium]|nr:hypothetical protein [Ktedonobacteraceae bacterium]
MKRRTIIGFVLLVGAVAVAGIVGTGGGPLSKNWLRGNTETNGSHAGSSTLIVQSSTVTVSAGYKYYTLKDTGGFLAVLAREHMRSTETPQPCRLGLFGVLLPIA